MISTIKNKWFRRTLLIGFLLFSLLWIPFVFMKSLIEYYMEIFEMMNGLWSHYLTIEDDVVNINKDEQ